MPTFPSPLTFHYDDSGYYAYILLKCDKPVLENIVQRLTPPKRVKPFHGKSSKPANDGKQYDWFIRIGIPSSLPENIVYRLDNFFFKNYGVHSYEKQQDLAQKERQQLLSQIELARRQQQEAEEYKELSLSLDEENQQLRLKLTDFSQKSLLLESELRSTQEQLIQQGEQLQKMQQLAKNTKAKRSALLQTVFNQLLPGLKFEKDSLDFLFYADHLESILPVLYELQNNPEMAGGTKVKARQGWKELRPGYDMRLYYAIADGTVNVLISPKKRQEIDIANL